MEEKKELAITTFPEVSTLFTDSWQLFTSKLPKIIVAWLYTVGMSILGIVVFLILGGITAFSKFAGNELNQSQIASALMSPEIITTFIILLVALVVFSSVVTLTLNAAMLFILSDKDSELSAWQYLKKGLPYLWPLFFTSIIVALIAIGSLFFFVIPYVIVLFLCMFIVYAVVLENKKGWDAIKMSANVISQNFWKILGRIVLLWLVFIVVSIVLGAMQGEDSPVNGIVTLVQFLINIFGGLYSSVYLFLLYKYARAAYVEGDKKPSYIWMPIIAVLGWIIAIFIGYAIITNIPTSSDMQKIIDQMESNGEDKIYVPEEDADPFMDEPSEIEPII